MVVQGSSIKDPSTSEEQGEEKNFCPVPLLQGIPPPGLPSEPRSTSCPMPALSDDVHLLVAPHHLFSSKILIESEVLKLRITEEYKHIPGNCFSQFVCSLLSSSYSLFYLVWGPHLAELRTDSRLLGDPTGYWELSPCQLCAKQQSPPPPRPSVSLSSSLNTEIL